MCCVLVQMVNVNCLILRVLREFCHGFEDKNDDSRERNDENMR